ncbi:hypothetical protein [Mycobacterium szulgai]|uniref:hypothetical protein n=1 Tax=Mycobacterium szulgai TaxID=1787 RepID=UPI0021F3AF1A|nr:hypothetical protein [Mycobacterium szulgai]
MLAVKDIAGAGKRDDELFRGAHVERHNLFTEKGGPYELRLHDAGQGRQALPGLLFGGGAFGLHRESTGRDAEPCGRGIFNAEHQSRNEVGALTESGGVRGAFIVFGTYAEFTEVLAELGCSLDVGMAVRCTTGPEQRRGRHWCGGDGAGSEDDRGASRETGGVGCGADPSWE